MYMYDCTVHVGEQKSSNTSIRWSTCSHVQGCSILSKYCCDVHLRDSSGKRPEDYAIGQHDRRLIHLKKAAKAEKSNSYPPVKRDPNDGFGVSQAKPNHDLIVVSPSALFLSLSLLVVPTLSSTLSLP